jgi:hypothetical protein
LFGVEPAAIRLGMAFGRIEEYPGRGPFFHGKEGDWQLVVVVAKTGVSRLEFVGGGGEGCVRRMGSLKFFAGRGPFGARGLPRARASRKASKPPEQALVPVRAKEWSNNSEKRRRSRDWLSPFSGPGHTGAQQIMCVANVRQCSKNCAKMRAIS